jgi:hypothetical protein
MILILVSKECVVVDSLSGRKLLIHIGNLLLEFTQAVPMLSGIYLSETRIGHAASKREFKMISYGTGILVEVEAEHTPNI